MTKFETEVETSLVKIPIDLWVIELETSNLIDFKILFICIAFCIFEIFVTRSLLNCSTSHMDMALHISWYTYACRKGHSMDRQPE